MAAALRRLLRSSTSLCYSTAERRGLSSLASEPGLRFPPLLHRAPLHSREDSKERNVQWVFLGCPGVGKGTYASRLSQLLGVPHIATGDLVREELSSSGPLAEQVLRRFPFACTFFFPLRGVYFPFILEIQAACKVDLVCFPGVATGISVD